MALFVVLDLGEPYPTLPFLTLPLPPTPNQVLGGLLPRWARPRRTDAADATGAVDALVAADAVGA